MNRRNQRCRSWRRLVMCQALFLVVSSCKLGIDTGQFLPDSGVDDPCIKRAELPASRCPGVSMTPVSTCTSQAGQWVMLVPKPAEYWNVGIKDGKSGQAAAAINWNDEVGYLAGFVVSRPSASTSAGKESLAVAKMIEGSGAFGVTTLTSAGSKSTTHHGDEVVIGAEVDISVASDQDIKQVRNDLFPILFGVDYSKLSNLPNDSLEISDKFKLTYATIIRGDRVIITGGVATLASHQSSQRKSRIRASDMASGTMLGALNDDITFRCETHPFDVPGKLDLLWVVDGAASAAMIKARDRMFLGVADMWNHAKDAGMDVRMAVLGMDQRFTGKLCNETTIACPSRGEGRLWSLAGLSCVQACLRNPVSSTSADEQYGLQSAQKAMGKLLPRERSKPDKLRTDARTMVVFVSDVEDQGVADLFLPGTIPSPLAAKEQALIDNHVKGFVNQLKPGSGYGLANTIPFAVLANPKAPCGGRRGAGYIELVQALGELPDQVLCEDQNTLDSALEDMIDIMAPRASLLKPRQVPITATLAAALNSSTIFRSRARGFDLDNETQNLLLYRLSGVLKTAGNSLALGYYSW